MNKTIIGPILCLIFPSVFFCLVMTQCDGKALEKKKPLEVHLDAGQKLVSVSHSKSGLYYLSRPVREGETPETSTFKNSETFGMGDSTEILFIEK